ncbi:MAG TPA: response regulator [Planctomycetota bacterium]|nr:response regulator [Planctomycetota bacterium]
MPSTCVVLVVDDNPADSKLMREAFDVVGFDGVVVAVENAPQAFAYLSRRPPYATVPMPHLVMLDLSMPVMSGFDVLREMKANPAWASIPVMIFSSSRQGSDLAKAERMGARRFITKPLDWNGFLQVARDVQGVCCEAA